MFTFILIVLGAGALAYYLCIMIPHWFRQGYKSKDAYRPKRNHAPAFHQRPVHAPVQPSTPIQIPLDDNKRKGDEFEKYIVGLFNSDSSRFHVMEWRSDKIADNGMYALSNHLPDLEMVFLDGRREYRFAIECKWRKQFVNGSIDWAKEYQISNYMDYQHRSRIPVFVAIGIGGEPSQPEALYLAPLQEVAYYPSLYESYLRQFHRNPTHRFFFNPKQKMLY